MSSGARSGRSASIRGIPKNDQFPKVVATVIILYRVCLYFLRSNRYAPPIITPCKTRVTRAKMPRSMSFSTLNGELLKEKTTRQGDAT